MTITYKSGTSTLVVLTSLSELRVMRSRHAQIYIRCWFSLVELPTATTIGLTVLGTAMATFKDAVSMNDTATNLADAARIREADDTPRDPLPRDR